MEFLFAGVGDEPLQPMMANQFESGNEDEDEEDLNVGNANPAHQEFHGGDEPPKEEHHPEGAEANQYQVYFYDSKEMVKLTKIK